MFGSELNCTSPEGLHPPSPCKEHLYYTPLDSPKLSAPCCARDPNDVTELAFLQHTATAGLSSVASQSTPPALLRIVVHGACPFISLFIHPKKDLLRHCYALTLGRAGDGHRGERGRPDPALAECPSTEDKLNKVTPTAITESQWHFNSPASDGCL